jgi:hypothetical protein
MKIATAWNGSNLAGAYVAVAPVLTSAEFRLKADEAALMARTVSYKPDRERYAAEAREWRAKEAAALADEANPPGQP